MGGVFGKSKKQGSRVTEQDKAVLVNFLSAEKVALIRKLIEKLIFLVAIEAAKRQDQAIPKTH
jgi:hypothetical protein